MKICKRKVTASTRNDSIRTIISITEFIGLSKDEIKQKLDELPVGTKISDVRNRTRFTNIDKVIEKCQSYKSNYFNPVGSPHDFKDLSTYWSISGYEDPYIVRKIYDIVNDQDKYDKISDEIKSTTNTYSEDEIEDLPQAEQKYDSAKTSINSNKLPAIYRMIHLNPGTIGVDFGGGKFDNAVEYLAEQGITLHVYDPYNRSTEHNREVLKAGRANGGFDFAINSNVLNVIKEPEARKNVLENIKRITKPGANIYITVYEGSGNGNEGETKSGYQLNRKTADYLQEIQEVFPDAKRKGKLISCTNGGSSVKSNTAIKSSVSIDDIITYVKSIIVEESTRYFNSIEYDTDYAHIDVLQSDHSTIKVEVRTEMEYEELEALSDVLNPIVARFDQDAYFEPVTYGLIEAFINIRKVAAKMGSKYVPVKGASYGGAFDIEDDQYFTKDDLINFGQTVCDQLNATYSDRFDITDLYIENNDIHMEILSEQGFEVTCEVPIDMRKVKKPSDILKFVDRMVYNMKYQLNDMYDEEGFDDIEESTSIEAGYYDPPEDNGGWSEKDVDDEIIDLSLDAVIHVYEDGSWEYDDNNYPWACSPDNSRGDWYTDEYNIYIGDNTSIVEKVDDLIMDKIPTDPGDYHITANVSLCYKIYGVESRITDYWYDENHGDEYDEEIYSEDATVELDEGNSSVNNFNIEKM